MMRRSRDHRVALGMALVILGLTFAVIVKGVI